MPHLVIEHADSISHDEISTACHRLHHALLLENFCPAAALKTRAKAYNDYLVGKNEAKEPFIHATLSLIEGRPLELRQQIAAILFDNLQQHFPQVSTITVDIREMSEETYRK